MERPKIPYHLDESSIKRPFPARAGRNAKYSTRKIVSAISSGWSVKSGKSLTIM